MHLQIFLEYLIRCFPSYKCVSSNHVPFISYHSIFLLLVHFLIFYPVSSDITNVLHPLVTGEYRRRVRRRASTLTGADAVTRTNGILPRKARSSCNYSYARVTIIMIMIIARREPLDDRIGLRITSWITRVRVGDLLRLSRDGLPD